MNQQRYTRNPVPRRAGLPQPTYNQVYSDDMVDSDDYDNDVYDDAWPTRTPRSAIRYTEPAAPVIVAGGRRYVLHANTPQQVTRQSIPQPRPPSRPQPQMQPRPQPQQVRRVAPPPPQPEYDDE